MAKCKALLVEDNKLNRDLAIELLKELGVKVIAADNGRSALSTIKAQDEGYFDIILMDINMPVMDGLEATRQIRALASGYALMVPILAMTADVSEQALPQTIEAGMNDFIQKPVDIQSLANKILMWCPDAELNRAYMPENDDADEPEWLKRLVGTNFSAADGLKYCGSMETYLSFLAEFVKSSGKTVAEIESALNRGDYEDLRMKAHANKSFTASLGNRPLSKLSEGMEKQAALPDEQGLKKGMPKFKDTYQTSVSQARAAIDDYVEVSIFSDGEGDSDSQVEVEEHFTQNHLLLMAETKSYMQASLVTQLQKVGFEVDFLLTAASKTAILRKSYDAYLIYLDENDSNASKTVLKIKEYLSAKTSPLVLIGYEPEIKVYEKVFPKERILATYPRPVDAKAISNDLRKIMTTTELHVKHHILIVDDDDHSLQLTRTWLEQDYHVLTADTAVQAIRILLAEQVDLILLDYEMPIVNGRIFTQMLRQDKALGQIPIVILTGKSDAGTVAEALQLGAVGYMLKSIGKEKALEILAGYFEKLGEGGRNLTRHRMMINRREQ